ncbi:MAG: phage protease [Pseudomonadota bacterium]
MGTPATSTALCAAVAIDAGGAVPDWLHLLPLGAVRTNDGRGPYRSPVDAAALMAASLKAAGGKLVLDENHATDLAAPKGGSAPARAWIVELQQRADGIWGRAEWTPTGRQLMEAGEYRGISPVIAHKRDGTITAILRASLTNTPNLQGLTALHSQETSMDFRKLLIEALGLDAEADDAAIAAALKARMDAKPADPAAVAAAMHSALAPLAAAVGLKPDAGADAILTSVQSLQQGDQSATITALQSSLSAMAEKVTKMDDDGAKQRATAFVDGAIAAGRIGVKPARDTYIAMHMKEPVQAETIINALPAVRGGALDPRDVEPKPGELSAADRTVVQLMGIDPAAYKTQLAADRGETQEII